MTQHGIKTNMIQIIPAAVRMGGMDAMFASPLAQATVATKQKGSRDPKAVAQWAHAREKLI
jgi:hypothetical protein